MRPAHICLLSILLVALCTSSTANGHGKGEQQQHNQQKQEITIYGQITKHGFGMKDATVYVYAFHKAGMNERVGYTKTDHRGYYEFKFMPKYDKYPDVYIQVKHKRSPVEKNVNGRQRIDLAVW